MWMLRIEPKFSGRAGSALNHIFWNADVLRKVFIFLTIDWYPLVSLNTQIIGSFFPLWVLLLPYSSMCILTPQSSGLKRRLVFNLHRVPYPREDWLGDFVSSSWFLTSSLVTWFPVPRIVPKGWSPARPVGTLRDCVITAECVFCQDLG